MARKSRCPACSAPMKTKRRFCSECGKPNPLFAAKSAAPAVPKAAGRPAAPGRPLTVVKPAQDAASEHWMREFYAERNPEQAAVFWGLAHPVLTGSKGAA